MSNGGVVQCWSESNRLAREGNPPRAERVQIFI